MEDNNSGAVTEDSFSFGMMQRDANTLTGIGDSKAHSKVVTKSLIADQSNTVTDGESLVNMLGKRERSAQPGESSGVSQNVVTKRGKPGYHERLVRTTEETIPSDNNIAYFEAVFAVKLCTDPLNDLFYYGEEERYTQLSEHLGATFCASSLQLSAMLDDRIDALEFKKTCTLKLLKATESCISVMGACMLKYYTHFASKLWRVKQTILESENHSKIITYNGSCHHFTIETSDKPVRDVLVAKSHRIKDDLNEPGDRWTSMSDARDNEIRFDFKGFWVDLYIFVEMDCTALEWFADVYERFRQEASQDGHPFGLLFDDGMFDRSLVDESLFSGVVSQMIDFGKTVANAPFDEFVREPWFIMAGIILETINSGKGCLEKKPFLYGIFLKPLIKSLAKIISRCDNLIASIKSQPVSLRKISGFTLDEFRLGCEELENLPQQEMEQDNECNICVSDVCDAIVVYDCAHAICVKCAMEWKSRKSDSCPICRSTIKELALLRVSRLVCDSERFSVGSIWGDKAKHLYQVLSRDFEHPTLILATHHNFSLYLAHFLTRFMGAKNIDGYGMFAYKKTRICCTTVSQYIPIRNLAYFPRVIFVDDVDINSQDSVFRNMAIANQGKITSIVLSDSQFERTVREVLQRKACDAYPYYSDSESELDDLESEYENIHGSDDIVNIRLIPPVDLQFQQRVEENSQESVEYLHPASPSSPSYESDSGRSNSIAAHCPNKYVSNPPASPSTPEYEPPNLSNANQLLSQDSECLYSQQNDAKTLLPPHIYELGSPSSPTYQYRLDRYHDTLNTNLRD